MIANLGLGALLVTAALVDPGDEVLMGDPSYPCNRQFLSGFGADVRLVPTDASSRFQLDLAAVQRHWSARTKGLMIATPSNPTGTSVPPAELAAICQWAQAHGAWRIVDEIYLNLSDAQADGTPAPTVLVADPGACVINSFSKYFGMTGWRLGWAVVPGAWSQDSAASLTPVVASSMGHRGMMLLASEMVMSSCRKKRCVPPVSIVSADP